jgi:ribosomal protein S21
MSNFSIEIKSDEPFEKALRRFSAKLAPSEKKD